MDITTIGTGIVAGIAYSLTAWSKKEGQEFDWAKFGTTAAVGALAGLGMAVMNIDVPIGYDMLIAGGAVPLIENIGKAIYRKFFK